MPDEADDQSIPIGPILNAEGLNPKLTLGDKSIEHGRITNVVLRE